MKITRKHITALFATTLTTTLLVYCLFPYSYSESRQSDNAKYDASVTVTRIGFSGLFNSLDKVIFRLANTDETIVLIKEFSGGKLDLPLKIMNRDKAFVQWNGELVKISDAWNRSVVWNAQDL
jgi:hypothetical protein